MNTYVELIGLSGDTFLFNFDEVSHFKLKSGKGRVEIKLKDGSYINVNEDHEKIRDLVKHLSEGIIGIEAVQTIKKNK